MATLSIKATDLSLDLSATDEELATFLVSMESSLKAEGRFWLITEGSLIRVPASAAVIATFDGDVPALVSEFANLFPDGPLE